MSVEVSPRSIGPPDDNVSRSASKVVSDRPASEKSRMSTTGSPSRVSFTKLQTDKSKTSNDDHQLQPFKMPPDHDIFMLRDQERQKKRLDREKQKQLRVYEKVPKVPTISFRQAELLGDGRTSSALSSASHPSGSDPVHTIAVTRDRQIENERLSEYIDKKREMFLLSYSLGVKRDEMRKLEEVAAEEERKLEKAEQFLEEDAAMFDEFLKENDKNSAEASQIADEEMRAKLAKVNEIKRLNAQMMQIKSEITKFEEQLKEYITYKEYLERLMPEEERERRRIRREKRAEEKAAVKDKQEISREKTDVSQKSAKSRGRVSMKDTAVSGKEKTVSSLRTMDEEEQSRVALEKFLDEIESEDEEDMELYFSEPQQLLDIFTELEEANLSLIQNCQESEEALEELKQGNTGLQSRMERETRTLSEQIDRLRRAIDKEEERANDLETKSKLFTAGGSADPEEQERLLTQLHIKVEQVYRSCFGDNEASISTLQMLTELENRIEMLFQTLEILPPDKVEKAQKSKDKERRLKLREEKKEQQRVHQEERVRKALERAKEPPKKHEGRRLMTRSNPPAIRRKDDGESERLTREEEEMAYFFT